ncbi:MAG: hypothetical protein N2109_02925 [Fimbriimonadales bacterium]|nr:hypothetical protein [Fimbriimonadales bacterium]
MNALLLVAAASLTQEPPKPVMRDFIGLNVHTVLFKPEVYKPVARLLRNYHPVGWDLGDSPANPTVFPSARNGVQWEQLYGSWKKEGYDVHATLMFEELPPVKWSDPERDAFAYGFCFARWFGPSSPSGLVSSVEIGNEPGEFDDALYARVFQAMAEGIRKADPKLRIATCASTHRASHRYAKTLRIFEAFPRLVDVVTVHTYPFLEQYPTWRRSHPEDERLSYLADVREVIAWRDRHAPGRPVWVTEFGYDASTRKPDPNREFARWEDVSDEQQARFVVRSFLLLAALDVRRAYLYWFNDDDEPQLHGSSGLTRRYEPKPAFHAVAHLLATLGDYRFVRKVSERRNDLYVYEFAKAEDPSAMAWVAWCATGSGQRAATRLPAIPGKLESVQRMPLVPGPWKSEPGPPPSIGEDPVYLFWRKR